MSERQRQHALRFGRKLALLLGPIALGWALLEWGLSRLPNSYSAKRARFDRDRARVEVVVLGSSHAANGVCAGLLGVPALNLATVSGDLHAEVGIAAETARAAPRLRVVLFEVPDFAFEYSLRESIEDWRVFFLHRYFDVSYERLADNFDLRSFSYAALYGRIGWEQMFGDLRTGTTPPDSVDPFGWEPSPGTVDDFDAAAKSAIARHDSRSDPAWIAGNVADMLAATRALRARGVTPVLFGTPLHSAYRRRLDPARAARHDEAMHRLTDSGAQYWDYSAVDGFTDAEFRDADHLNPLGAEHFSRLLAERLRAL